MFKTLAHDIGRQAFALLQIIALFPGRHTAKTLGDTPVDKFRFVLLWLQFRRFAGIGPWPMAPGAPFSKHFLAGRDIFFVR